ncbi:MAG: HDOD domain-containing protein [Phycisphaera sp.]|nr:HDOD domain-containing protein [Phycisphaera sp.]
MLVTDPSQASHVELILRRLDSLPTLPAVATRLLSLTSSDDSHARDVIELVKSDQALTAKLLMLCRHADMGIREEVTTIDRAVVLLGFNAVRNAVLSIKVIESLQGAQRRRSTDVLDADNQTPQTSESEGATFRGRAGFWRHSLAVGIACEKIARLHPEMRELPPSEAFVCGLLHDIGKVALDYLLPKAYARVVELTDLNRGQIAEFERRVIGIDHHTVGKRLAEQWQLPQRVLDSIWLHGSPYATLPNVEHRRMIALVTLADLIVRRQHLGYSGNHEIAQSVTRVALDAGFNPNKVEQAAATIHEELEKRSQAMGLDAPPSRELYLSSIEQANLTLGRLNAALERRSRVAHRLQDVVKTVASFTATWQPGRTVRDAVDAVARGAATLLGEGFLAVIHQTPVLQGPAQWTLCLYDSHGQPTRSESLDSPPLVGRLDQLDPDSGTSLSLHAILPWAADYLGESVDIRKVRTLPLRSESGLAAVLLHDQELALTPRELEPISMLWSTAILEAQRHDEARRIGEQLAQANRALAQAQDELLHSRSMARLGEMAAGAAHEMNNPLAVISGRSQLLTMTLHPGSDPHKAATTIYEQAHRLSDLITSLRMFADPPPVERQQTDLHALLDQTLRSVKGSLTFRDQDKDMSLTVKTELPTAWVDGPKIAAALTEVLHNAIQSQANHVRVVAQCDSTDNLLIVRVTDDGVGMDEHTLEHAFDPFYSAKSAGRRMGMGLPRARQHLAAHNGRIDLRSTPGEGTTATLVIPLD